VKKELIILAVLVGYSIVRYLVVEYLDRKKKEREERENLGLPEEIK